VKQALGRGLPACDDAQHLLARLKKLVPDFSKTPNHRDNLLCVVLYYLTFSFQAVRMVTGYEKLGNLIGRYPSLSIYRKFGALASENLLHMQAELLHLEAEIRLIKKQDRQDPEKAGFGTCWSALRGASSNGGADLQWRRSLEIRQKLAEYCSYLPAYLSSQLANSRARCGVVANSTGTRPTEAY
jgi:hypothetical protein